MVFVTVSLQNGNFQVTLIHLKEHMMLTLLPTLVTAATKVMKKC